ncbi:MAG TPA: tetratricopeptide repeat protein [Dongiaceae bacterium]|nr:tetratricopeptide repeat protein [Dongiaceae bacterium]
MRRLCWLLLLFLVTAPLAAHADGFALAKQGFQAQKQGQWDEAIRLYSAALEAGDLDDKSRLLVMGLRGNALGIRGRYDEAVQAFDAAIRRDPSSPLPYVGRGMVHLQMGAADLAIADDEAAMKIAPEDRFAQANRALARFYLGRFDAAAEDYASLHAHDPADAGFLLWLHIARERAGADDDDAFRQDAAAIDPARWPGPAVAYFLGQGTAEEVMAAADQGSKAERLQQGCEAGFYLGEAALLKGDRSTAQAEFRKVLTDCDLYRGNYVYFSRAYGAAAAELKRLP